MESTDYGSSVWIAKDGQLVIWPGMEHCLVMIGFDSAKNEVYMADPLNENITTYNFSVFYQRWICDHGKPAGIRQYVQRLGHTGWCLWTDL